MSHRGVLTIAAGIALVFVACTSTDSETAGTRAVNKPWKDISPPTQEFTFNAESGDTITLNDGTCIRIPGGILVDSKGATVTGEVTLDYTTMYTPAEIIASGIPMDYDSAGANYNFQSAGMFEMNASQGEEQLAIKQGNSIDMDFPTTRKDETYSFYRYDGAAANNWSFQNVPEVDSNQTRLALEEAIAEATVPPVKPEEYVAGTPVIDLEFELDKHPELSGYEGVIWQYAGSGKNPEDNRWIYNEVWTTADLGLADRAQGTYNLYLKNDKKAFSTMIRPVLKGANYEDAIAEFTTRMEKFESEEAVRREEAERVRTIPPYMSSLSVLVFGIHNLDCIYHRGDFIMANVQFALPKFAGSRGDVTVYIVSGTLQTTIAYNAGSDKCYYQRGASNKVIAVDHKSGKTFTMTASEFNAAAFTEPANLKLTMNENSTPVADMAGLQKLIDEL
jgi:hypothetical protein